MPSSWIRRFGVGPSRVWQRWYPLRFAAQPVTPLNTATFEKEVATHLREFGRLVVEATYNQIEPDASADMPPLIHWEATQYRPVGEKTPNRHVASLFGTLTLWRHGYHASQRITTMAEALFGSGRKADAWAEKMRKLLKKPSGVRRVLHSAAALKARLGLRRHVQSAFRKAYNYLRQRSQYMRYAECRRLGLPIGSGITEAACKTIFTPRWQSQRAQRISTRTMP